MGWLLDGLFAAETGALFSSFCSAASKGTTCCRGGKREHLKVPFIDLQQQCVRTNNNAPGWQEESDYILHSSSNTGEPVQVVCVFWGAKQEFGGDIWH